MIMQKKILLLLSLFTLLAGSFEAAKAQSVQLDSMIKVSPEQVGNICTLDPTEINANFKFAPERPQKKQPGSATNSNIQISYVSDCNGSSWSQDAQEAFEYAASIWEDHLQSDIPIRIEANWVSLGENTLGSAGPTTLFTLTGGDIEENTFYTISQASALTGIDIVNEVEDVNFDIVVNINCEFANWYFGTDANPPANLIDMVTVMIHEIGHGIGFTGSVSGSPGSQTAELGLGQNQFPIIYDLFALDGFFDEITDEEFYSTPSNIYDGVTGRNNGLFFSGRESEFTLGGDRVPLYAPSTWRPGSSFSHVDQEFFENSENALMRPRIDRAFAIHSPGPLFCGILDDMGWPLGNSCLDLIEDDALLDRPFLSAPANGQKGETRVPDLIWNPVNGANEYRFQLADNFDFDTVTEDVVVSDTTFSIENSLSSETLYFWRIKALDSQGEESNWSQKWRFTTTIPAPDAVVLTSPEDGSINFRPGSQLRWETADRSSSYTIQISEDPDFSAPFIDRAVNGTAFSASQALNFSTTYFWRVKAENSGGESDWSDTWLFDTIIEKPEVVDLASQGGPTTQVSVTPRLTWDPSERAADYEIQISTSENDFSAPAVEGSSSEAEFTVDNQLEFATIYYWRVKAVNIGGESAWSEPESFTTQVLQTEIASNYPNPFNTSTTLRYQLSDTRDVFIEVYDIGGRRISVLVNEEQQAGVYFYRFNGSGYSSGVYFVRFRAGDVTDIQKMTLIK